MPLNATARMAIVTLSLAVACTERSTVAASPSAQDTATTGTASVAELIDRIVRSYHDLGMFQGAAIVAVDGDVIYRGAFGLANAEWDVANTSETKFRIASHGKMFTAAIILQLVEEGRVDLDRPVSAFLPEYRRDLGDRITIHHLLSHTSGLPRVLPEWEDTRYRNPYTLDRIVSLANELELVFQPGERIGYSNVGFNLLAAVIENVTGKPYEHVLRERILQPLAMTNTGLVRHSPILPGRASNYNRLPWGELVNAPYMDESFAVGAGGLYSTVDDMLKWHEGLFNNAILSEESKRLMFGGDAGGSGYGCDVGSYVTRDDRSGRTLVLAMGGTSGAASVTFRLVDDRVSIILLGNIREIPQARIASNITNAIVGVPLNPIREPAINAFSRRLLGEDVEDLVEDYHAAREAGEEVPAEDDVNRLGYRLLGLGRLEDALKVFRFNVAAFPDSWNVYDSLGEGYMLSGEPELAIRNYRRSVELNPDNVNGRRMLEKLTAGGEAR